MLARILGRPAQAVLAANAARDKREWDKAAVLYRRYLRGYPDDAGIWVQYGHSLKESGRFIDASKAYHRALLITPNDADLHLQIGHLNKISGQIRAAIASYRRALEVEPGMHAAQAELDNLQSVSERSVGQAWRLSVDRGLQDAMSRIKLLEQRIQELEMRKSNEKAKA